MQVAFRNVRREGSTITAEGNHNCGEHLFKVRIEGATSLLTEDLKLFTEPSEYATEMFAVRGACSLFFEVLETGQDYIEKTGFIYAVG